MTTKLDEAAAKAIDKITDLASALQGPGFEAAKSAVTVEATSTLVSGIVSAAIALACAYCTRWAYRKARDAEFDSELGFFVVAFISGLIGVFSGARAIWVFVDPWTWAAINHPELWLAKRALGL